MSRRRKKQTGEKRLLFIESPIIGECPITRRKGDYEELVTKDIGTLDQAQVQPKWVHPQFLAPGPDDCKIRGRVRRVKRTSPKFNDSRFPALRFRRSKSTADRGHDPSAQTGINEDNSTRPFTVADSSMQIDDRTNATYKFKKPNTRAQKKLSDLLAACMEGSPEPVSTHFLLDDYDVAEDNVVILVDDTPDKDWGLTFRQRQLQSPSV